jgi:hypothetical protein
LISKNDVERLIDELKEIVNGKDMREEKIIEKREKESYEKGWKDGRKELAKEIEKKLQLWKLSGEDNIYCVHKVDWIKFVENLKKEAKA